MGSYIVETDDGSKYQIDTEEKAAAPAQKGLFGTLVDKAKSILPFAQSAIKYGPMTSAREAFMSNPQAALNALPPAGMVAGGALGSGVASIPMAGLGQAAGEAAKQLGERAMGLPSAPQTSSEAAANIGGQAIGGALSEVGAKALPFVADAVSPALGAVGKTIGKGLAMTTGRTTEDFARLINDWKAYLPNWAGGSKTVANATTDFGKALAENGMTTEKVGEQIADPQAAAKKTFATFYDVYQLAKKTGKDLGGLITPSDALEARQATDAIMPTLKNRFGLGKGGGAYAMASEFRDKLNGVLADKVPGFLEQSNQYGRAILGAKFAREPFAVNKGGTTSIMRTLLTKGIGGTAGLPLTSPMLTGALTAGAGATGELLGKILDSPKVLSAFTSYLSQQPSEGPTGLFKTLSGKADVGALAALPAGTAIASEGPAARTPSHPLMSTMPKSLTFDSTDQVRNTTLPVGTRIMVDGMPAHIVKQARTGVKVVEFIGTNH